jgi:hypothetical protein
MATLQLNDVAEIKQYIAKQTTTQCDDVSKSKYNEIKLHKPLYPSVISDLVSIWQNLNDRQSKIRDIDTSKLRQRDSRPLNTVRNSRRIALVERSNKICSLLIMAHGPTALSQTK